jgi:hypothetical protein
LEWGTPLRPYDLLEGRRFLVQEFAAGILLDRFETLANGVFGKFENLPGAAFGDGYVAEAERFFLRVAFIPKVV